MAEKVIRPNEAIKGCAFTGCAAVLIFVLLSICYLVYIFYIDDSLASP